MPTAPGGSAEKTATILAASIEQQQRFVDALPQGELQRVDTSHGIPNEAPQLVVDAVLRTLNKAR
jgi:hypothetical protein